VFFLCSIYRREGIFWQRPTHTGRPTCDQALNQEILAVVGSQSFLLLSFGTRDNLISTSLFSGYDDEQLRKIFEHIESTKPHEPPPPPPDLSRGDGTEVNATGNHNADPNPDPNLNPIPNPITLTPTRTAKVLRHKIVKDEKGRVITTIDLGKPQAYTMLL